MPALALDQIRVDGGTNSRAHPDQDYIRELAEAVAEKAKFPDVIVFHDGEYYWLADGFQRVAAHRLAKATAVNAEIKEGTRRDALLFSVGCNEAHGLRRTTEDKLHAVKLILADDTWQNCSSRWIAEQCKVGPHFVENIRLTSTARAHSCPTRVGKDGKKRTLPAGESGEHADTIHNAPSRNGAQKSTPRQRTELLSRYAHELDKLQEQSGRPKSHFKDFHDRLKRLNAEVEALAQRAYRE